MFRNTLEVVSRFTNTAVFSPDKTYFSDDAVSFFGVVESPEVSKEFALYDEISSLIRMASLFENPVFDIGEKITISDGNSTASFLTSDVSLVRRNGFDMETQFERTLAAPTCLEFKLSESDLSRIKGAGGVIQNASLIIQSDLDNSKATVTVKDVDVLSSDSNSYSIVYDNGNEDFKVEKSFSIKSGLDLFTRLPKGDYSVKIVYSSAANSYRMLIESLNMDLSIVTSCEVI